jgi:hypothetical protein
MKAITWDDDISDERRDELIDLLAGKVVKHGMATPAILFLEMHKPFAFLASQTVILSSGFLIPFVGIQNVQDYSKLMETRSNVEKLICRIEALQATNSAEPALAGKVGKSPSPCAEKAQ